MPCPQALHGQRIITLDQRLSTNVPRTSNSWSCVYLPQSLVSHERNGDRFKLYVITKIFQKCSQLNGVTPVRRTDYNGRLHGRQVTCDFILMGKGPTRPYTQSVSHIDGMTNIINPVITLLLIRATPPNALPRYMAVILMKSITD